MIGPASPLTALQVARRVRLVVWLLRLMGLEREAQRLQTGHQQWDEANSLKNDIGLLFRCAWSGGVLFCQFVCRSPGCWGTAVQQVTSSGMRRIACEPRPACCSGGQGRQGWQWWFNLCEGA